MPSSMTAERLDAQSYGALVHTLPKELFVPFEQSPQWGLINEDGSARTRYGLFAFRQAGELVAICSVYRFKRPTRESLVALAGPVFVAERTPEAERGVLDALIAFVRADDSVDPLYIRLHLEHPEVYPGTKLSIERAIYEREVVVDVDKTPEELKKSFSSNARTRINRAGRAGVEIREITENLGQYFEDVCFPLMEETAARDNFAPLSSTVYRETLEKASENTRLFVAFAPATDDDADADNKIPVAWMMTNEYHYRGCYYHGASNARAQETSAMFALMYRILVELGASGNLAVGLTGISSERYPELKGVENFKLRFSKQIADYPRLYDVPLNRVRYEALRTLLTARAEGPAAVKKTLSTGRSVITKAVSAARRKA